MLKNSRWFVLLGLAVLLFLSTRACSPVPRPKEKDCLIDEGVITHIEIRGKNDIMFNLADNPRKYYINRGLESGLDLAQFKAQLIGSTVVIKYLAIGRPSIL
ncbi:MAG: hypothetical protein IPL46_24965 [Saprospiraceae bacterium]|nr:hypothetical protein [Saprospiraceae bacterium]